MENRFPSTDRPGSHAVLFSGVSAALLVLLGAGLVSGDTFTETYYFNTAGIATSDTPGNGFQDMSPGPDFLPYTDDDVILPENGNVGGTWGFAALDNDGDGVPDHIFTCTRRDDDDTYTLTSYSEFEHGVFAEGEDWIDLHEGNNQGPSGDGNQGVDLGDDFEWNDRPNWEGQSNWFWYNNLVENQRGLGGSRYYFELKNGEGTFDEVQRWVKMVNLQTNADDPNTTPFNEESNSYARGGDVTIKGLLIPISEISVLRDGELDSLFGWQTVDMAKYVRDVLGPKLEDPNLTYFQTDEGGNACGTTHNLMPPTFLMIEEGEFQVILMPGGEEYAAYWGIEPLQPGGTETSSVFRWCRILLKGDDDSYLDDGWWNPPIKLVPDDGSRENLWVREKFVRENIQEFDPFSGTGTGLPDSWGALTLGCGIPTPDPDNTPPDACWFFFRDTDDQGFPMLEDCQKDYVLTLPAGSGPQDSWFSLPTSPLDAGKGKVRAEVQVRFEDVLSSASRVVQVALTGAGRTQPVAWVNFVSGMTARVGVGGDLGAGGSGPAQGPILATGGPVDIATAAGTYTLLELIFDAGGRKITARIDGIEVVSGIYGDFDGSIVDGLRIWTESGPGAENQIYVNEAAVLQEFPRSFIRGESNNDGIQDLSDAVYTLSYLFLGGPPPGCIAAADTNGDGGLDISDPVSLLSFLFTGGAVPPAPFPVCGVDWSTSLPCEIFISCP